MWKNDPEGNVATCRRRCIGCGISRDKREMIRIVRTAAGELHLDPGGKTNGRGAYLCPDPACFARAVKSKALKRSFREEYPADCLKNIEEEWKRLMEQSAAADQET